MVGLSKLSTLIKNTVEIKDKKRNVRLFVCESVEVVKERLFYIREKRRGSNETVRGEINIMRI
jgi:hypothetical protein